MKKFLGFAAVAATVILYVGSTYSEDPKPAPTGPPCDVKMVRLGWFCADCKEFKNAKGDCCDPCACKGCTDGKRVAVLQVCVKEYYVCTMGCPDDGAAEASPCPKCGAPRGKKESQARVIYKCPKCGDVANPILYHHCPKCGSETKAKECEKCHLKYVPDFKSPGPCGKDHTERVLTCDHSGAMPHSVVGAGGGGEKKEDGKSDEPKKEEPKKEEPKKEEGK